MVGLVHGLKYLKNMFKVPLENMIGKNSSAPEKVAWRQLFAFSSLNTNRHVSPITRISRHSHMEKDYRLHGHIPLVSWGTHTCGRSRTGHRCSADRTERAARCRPALACAGRRTASDCTGRRCSRSEQKSEVGRCD